MTDAFTDDGRQPPPAGSRGRAWRVNWLEGSLIIAFWVSIFVLTVGQRAIDPWGPRGLVLPEVLGRGLEYVLWVLLTPGILWLARRFSLERGMWPRHLLLHVVIALTVAVAVDLFGHASFNAVTGEQRRPVTLAFSLLALHFLDEFIIYLTVLAAGFARDYFLRYQERQREAAELRARTAELQMQATQLQAQLAEARLQALRMQINPHFLFNTLHTISTYIERDPRGVRRMIARLSDLLRYTLDQEGVKEVPLRQELGFLEGYLEIQRIRFRDRLEVHQDVDPGVLEALVPNLILQPLVENAIKHGVSNLEAEGRIELRAWREGERLHLSVYDNGPGLASSLGDGAPASSQGIGLRNTRERLESLYGKEQSLALKPAEGGGLVAHLSLPYHTSADLFTTTA